MEGNLFFGLCIRLQTAREKLEPFLPDILTVLMTTLSRCQRRSLLTLYDTIGALADSAGPLLNRPVSFKGGETNFFFVHMLVDTPICFQDYIATLMGPLTEKWTQLADDDRDLLPLLEVGLDRWRFPSGFNCTHPPPLNSQCLGYVAVGLKDGFAPYVDPMFERCARIVAVNLKAQLVGEDVSEGNRQNNNFNSPLDRNTTNGKNTTRTTTTRRMWTLPCRRWI